jgi:hypothetical protein
MANSDNEKQYMLNGIKHVLEKIKENQLNPDAFVSMLEKVKDPDEFNNLINNLVGSNLKDLKDQDRLNTTAAQ